MPNLKKTISIKKELMQRIVEISKLERTKPDAFVNKALSEYLNLIVEEKGIENKAIDKYMANKLNEKKLTLIVGKEKAKAAKITKRIQLQGKKFLKSI